MSRKLVEIAADIVQAQVATRQMSSDEIATSLKQVFNTLAGIQKFEAEGVAGEAKEGDEALESKAEKADPKNSIQNDKVVCLECGAEMRQLTTKHLSSHGLTPREYKSKWGLSMKQPLSAKSLTKARSRAAKKRGLPENLVKYIESKKLARAEAAAQTGAEGALEAPETKPLARRVPKKRVNPEA